MLFRHAQHPSQDDLSAFADGELAPLRLREVELHVASCAACEALLAELRENKALLSRLPRAETRRSFAITSAVAAPARPAPRLRALSFASAVTLSLLVALLLVDAGAFSGSGDESLMAGRADNAPSSSKQGEPAVQRNAEADAAALPPSASPQDRTNAAPGGAFRAATPPAVAAGASQASPGAGITAPTAPQPGTAPASAPAPSQPPPAPFATTPVAAPTSAPAGAQAIVPTPAPAVAPRPAAVSSPVTERDGTTAVEEREGDDGAGDTLLRALEVAAAAAFVASMLAYFWPRLTRRGDTR